VLALTSFRCSEYLWVLRKIPKEAIPLTDKNQHLKESTSRKTRIKA
jgi:hypothetical protein